MTERSVAFGVSATSRSWNSRHVWVKAIAVGDHRRRPLDVLPQHRDDRGQPVGPPGAGRGAQRFEQLQCGGEVVERDAVALEDEAEVVRSRARFGPVGGEPADLAAPDGDEPLGLEDADRLADRGEAHPELLHQLVLGGEVVDALTGGEDAAAQLGGHQLGDARLLDAGALAGGSGAGAVWFGHRRTVARPGRFESL